MKNVVAKELSKGVTNSFNDIGSILQKVCNLDFRELSKLSIVLLRIHQCLYSPRANSKSTKPDKDKIDNIIEQVIEHFRLNKTFRHFRTETITHM